MSRIVRNNNQNSAGARLNGNAANGTAADDAAFAGALPLSSPEPRGEMLLERAMLLQTDLRRVGNHRKVNNSQVEVDAEKSAIHVHKQLLDAPSLQAIFVFDNSVRRHINSRCLPSFFRKGIALLPLTIVAEMDEQLTVFSQQRSELVDRFCDAYPDLVTAAQNRLRGLFDPRDYPPVEVVRAAFRFEWQYLSINVPSTLAAIDRSIFSRERQKAQQQWDEAARSVQTLLRAQMTELVSHMTDRLTPGPDGQPKVFRNTMVSNFAEFLSTFDARNLTDDAELAALVSRARELLDGVDTRTLRSNEDVRETVCAGFGEIRHQLDRMVTNRPVRRIVVERRVKPQAQASQAQDNRALSAGASDTAAVGSEADEVAVIQGTSGANDDAEMMLHRLPLPLRVTPEFRAFDAACRRAGLEWASPAALDAFSSAFARATTEGVGLLVAEENLTSEDFEAAVHLIERGELRW